MRRIVNESMDGLYPEQIEVFRAVDFNKMYLDVKLMEAEYEQKLYKEIKKLKDEHYLRGYQARRQNIKTILSEFELKIPFITQRMVDFAYPHFKEEYDEFWVEYLSPECVKLEIYIEGVLASIDQFAVNLVAMSYENDLKYAIE